MPSEPIIELSGVSKRYGTRTVLSDVHLRLDAAATYVLLGPSGCGKSTVLRLMIGLIRPDAGIVRVRGQAFTPDNVLQMRRATGYVIQDGGLFPHLTARQNTALVANYLNWSRERITQRVHELAELTHFPIDGLDRYPSQLSGGQRQRVGLMRSLMLDPDILLLDEPLGALDPMIRHELQTDLREIFRSLHKTVVLVTHDLHEAAGFADQLILLRDGRIVQQGSLEKLLQEPAEPFVTQFVNAQRSFSGV